MNNDDSSNINDNRADDIFYLSKPAFATTKKRAAPAILFEDFCVLGAEDDVSPIMDNVKEPAKKKKNRFDEESLVIDLTIDEYGDSPDMPNFMEQKQPSVISLIDCSTDDGESDDDMILFDEHPPQQQQYLGIRKPSPVAVTAADFKQPFARRYTFPLSSSTSSAHWYPPQDMNEQQDGTYFRLGEAKTKKQKRSRRYQERRATMPLVNQQEQHYPPFVVGFMDAVATQLSHAHKHENFQTARRSQFLLREELEHLHRQLASVVQQQHQKRTQGDVTTTSSSSREEATVEYQLCRDQIQLVQRELTMAQKNAARDIYHRNNSAGTMGMDEAGKLYIDFHGLYVKEAIERFHETVLPVLPVQKIVQIIVGQGKHSHNTGAALKFGLLRYLQNKVSIAVQRDDGLQNIHCEVDPRNHGVLIVRWQDRTVLPKRTSQQVAPCIGVLYRTQVTEAINAPRELRRKGIYMSTMDSAER